MRPFPLRLPIHLGIVIGAVRHMSSVEVLVSLTEGSGEMGRCWVDHTGGIERLLAQVEGYQRSLGGGQLVPGEVGSL